MGKLLAAARPCNFVHSSSLLIVVVAHRFVLLFWLFPVFFASRIETMWNGMNFSDALVGAYKYIQLEHT